jgi:hypothetical protein
MHPCMRQQLWETAINKAHAQITGRSEHSVNYSVVPSTTTQCSMHEGVNKGHVLPLLTMSRTYNKKAGTACMDGMHGFTKVATLPSHDVSGSCSSVDSVLRCLLQAKRHSCVHASNACAPPSSGPPSCCSQDAAQGPSCGAARWHPDCTAAQPASPAWVGRTAMHTPPAHKQNRELNRALSGVGNS